MYAMTERKGARSEGGTQLSITTVFCVNSHYNGSGLNTLFEAHNKDHPVGIPPVLDPSPWDSCNFCFHHSKTVQDRCIVFVKVE